MPAYRVLLIGGYGFFGRKLAQRLGRDDRLDVILAGRDLAAAKCLAGELNREGRARFSAMALDASAASLSPLIASTGAQVVVHMSGPFQGQGYHVARACIAAGAHYIDLADAREFVCGIGQLDSEARAAAVVVTSGASSVPALSAAVVDHLARDFTEVLAIDVGISPGNRTQRGLATVAAILGYCGRAFTGWQDGAWREIRGWHDLRRFTYPAPVGPRWLANCDVPDLALFPERYAGTRSVSFGAGLELPVLHWGLWLLANLRRLRLLPDLSRFASPLKRASDLFIPFGSDAGAMHVLVTGTTAAGRTGRRLWTLLAQEGDGPYVPTLAAAALVHQLANGKVFPPGAKPCMGLLTLQEFEAASAGLAITTSITSDES